MIVTIVEDELPAAGFLKGLLEEQDIVPISEIIEIETVQEAIVFFKETTPDLIFLDVHLADGSSFEIFKHVTVAAPIIFTTAYDQYALDAFKLFTLDYLLKPYEKSALHKALDKLKLLGKSVENTDYDQISTLFSESEKPQFQQQFIINHGNEIRTINHTEIAYFYATGKHLFIFTNKRESFLYDGTIKDLESKLNPQTFFKINRNYIINIYSVKKVIKRENFRISVELVPSPPDTEKIMVSKGQVRAFKEWLNH